MLLPQAYIYTYIYFYFMHVLHKYRIKSNIRWLHSVCIRLWISKWQIVLRAIFWHALKKKRYSLYFGFHVLLSIAIFYFFLRVFVVQGWGVHLQILFCATVKALDFNVGSVHVISIMTWVWVTKCPNVLSQVLLRNVSFIFLVIAFVVFFFCFTCLSHFIWKYFVYRHGWL